MALPKHSKTMKHEGKRKDWKCKHFDRIYAMNKKESGNLQT